MKTEKGNFQRLKKITCFLGSLFLSFLSLFSLDDDGMFFSGLFYYFEFFLLFLKNTRLKEKTKISLVDKSYAQTNI